MIMPKSPFDYVLSVIAVSICVLFFLLVRSRKRYDNLPPGPRGYPFIGNLFELKAKSLKELVIENRQKFGDIFPLQIFNTVFIVCSGYDVLKEMLVKNGQCFKDRPAPRLENAALPGKGIITSSGEIWKQNRRFAMHVLKDFGMGKNKIEIKIHEEIRYLLDTIDQMSGVAFDIKHILHNAVSNVICSIVFGERFSYDDQEFRNLIHNLDEICKIPTFFKPTWFRYIPGDLFRVREYINRLASMNGFYKKKIDEHLAKYDQNRANSLIDVYIQEMKDTGGTEGDLTTTDELMRIIHDVFIAGTETTATALRWGLVYLIRNPEIQTMIHNELDNNVPVERLPSSSDKLKLNYLHATTLEILRLGNILPCIGRSACENTQLKGYTVPRSIEVIASIETVLLDSELWEEPHTFNPSRFISDDVSIKKLEHFIPFGLGARVCPGEALARTELYLFISALLQRYQFLPPEGDDPPSLDCDIGISHAPKHYLLRAIKRTHLV